MCPLSSMTGSVTLNCTWRHQNLHPDRLMVNLGERHVHVRGDDHRCPVQERICFLQEGTFELSLAGREAALKAEEGCFGGGWGRWARALSSGCCCSRSWLV